MSAAPLPGSERPGRRVKYLSDNRFIAGLIQRYGDLPLQQLITKWKQDEFTQEKAHEKNKA